MTKRILLFILCLFASASAGVIVPDRIDYRFNVKRFGATGDGTTDDQTALQKAIDSAANSNGGVYVPEGVYLHSSCLRIPDSVIVFGEGTLKSTDVTTPNPQHAIIIKGLHSGLQGVKIATSWAGTRQSNNNGSAVVCSAAVGFTVEDVTITGAATAGIIVFGGSNGEISKCYVASTLADGINITNGARAITVDECKSISTGDDGISVVSKISQGVICEDITISDNTVRGGATRGITVVGGRTIGISKNNVNNPAYAGIYIASESSISSYGSTNVTITGNIVDSSGSSSPAYGSLQIWGRGGFPTEDVTVTGNIFTNCRYVGLIISNTSEAVDTATVDIRVSGGNIFHAVDTNSVMGVLVSGGKDILFTSNSVENFGSYGLTVGAAEGGGTLTINDNLFHNINWDSTASVDCIGLTNSNWDMVVVHDNSYLPGLSAIERFVEANTFTGKVDIAGNYAIGETDFLVDSTVIRYWPSDPYSTQPAILSHRVRNLVADSAFHRVVIADSAYATKKYVDNFVLGSDTTAKALYNPGTVNDTLRFLTDAGNTRDTLHVGSDEVAVIVRSTDSLYVEANQVGIPGGPVVIVVPDSLRANDSSLASLGKSAFPWADLYVDKIYLHETTGTNSRIPISQVGPSTGQILKYDGTDWAPASIDSASAKKYTWGPLNWRYVDTSTADGDPGPNLMRFNNATTNAATFAYVDDITMAGYSVDSLVHYAQAGDRLWCKKAGTLSQQIFRITGLATDGTGYWKLPIAFIDGVTDFTHQDTLLFEIISARDSVGAGGAGGADSFRAIRLVHPTANTDTTYWKTDDGTHTNDTLHVGSDETAVVIASNDTLKVAADQIGKGAALLNLTGAGLIPVSADSMDLGTSAVKYDTVFANVLVGAAAGSGSGDTLIINIGGTEYSIVNNRIKAKVGPYILFAREDSTSFDVWRISADTSLSWPRATKSDSTGKVDTQYAPLRALVIEHIDDSLAEYLPLAGGAMSSNADITFSGGGDIYTLDTLSGLSGLLRISGDIDATVDAASAQTLLIDSLDLGEGLIGILDGNGLGISAGSLVTNVGTNMEINSDALRPSVDIAGNGLTGGGANDLDVAPGTGISVAGDVVSATLGTAVTQNEIEATSYLFPLNWVYSTTTTLADPGTGAMRFNASLTTATEAYVDSVTAAGLGRIPDSLLAYLQKGDMISFMEPASPGSRLFFNVTDRATDTSGFWKLFINPVVGTGTGIANGDTLICQIHWTRDTTGTGGGGGDDTVTVLGDVSSGPDDRLRWLADSLKMEDLTANAQQLYLGSTTDKVQLLGDSGLTIGRLTDAAATEFHPDSVRAETASEALLGTAAVPWKVVNTDSVQVRGVNMTGDLIVTSGANQTIGVDSVLLGGDQIGEFAGTGLTVSAGALTSTLGTSVDLASAEVTGTLPIENGGTEATTFTDGGIITGNGTAALQVTAVLTEGQLLIGDGTTEPTIVAMSGDGVLPSTGVLNLATNGVDDDEINHPSRRRLPDRWATRPLETEDSLVISHSIYRMNTTDSLTTEIWDIVDSSYDAAGAPTPDVQCDDTLWALWQLQPGEDQIDSFILLMDNESTPNDSSCIYKIQFYRWVANAFDVDQPDLSVTTGWVSGAAAQDFSTDITNITTADPGEFYAVRVICGITSGATKGRLGFNLMLVFDD